MIQIPVAVFARFWRNERTSTLKKVKHAEKDENSIPFKYYRTAIASIIRFHKGGNNAEIFKKTRESLIEKLNGCETRGRETILKNNLRAIELYEAHFAQRKFQIRPVPKLKILASKVVVSAKLDMHVLENGEELLIKLDMCKAKMNSSELKNILAITNEAAQRDGINIPASNVLMLRLQDGSQIAGEPLTNSQKRSFKETGRAIEQIWEDL